MQVRELKLPGVLHLQPERHGDDRGWFCEMWNEATLQNLGIRTRFVQENRSYSQKMGTLRGLHCQVAPMEQGKLVTCLRGRILDVVVDVRPGSPNYGEWVSEVLDAQTPALLWVPPGCLHGFLTQANDTEVVYHVDAPYSREHERSYAWNDPQFGIAWGAEAYASLTLSPKDASAPCFTRAAL